MKAKWSLFWGATGRDARPPLAAIMGLVRVARTGSVRIDGTETVTACAASDRRIRVGYCPEERGIFSSLSTEENLLLRHGLKGAQACRLKRFTLFSRSCASAPPVRARACRVGNSRCWRCAHFCHRARLRLLDEISEGLAPVDRAEAGRGNPHPQGKGLYRGAGEQELPVRRSSWQTGSMSWESGRIVMPIQNDPDIREANPICESSSDRSNCLHRRSPDIEPVCQRSGCDRKFCRPAPR